MAGDQARRTEAWRDIERAFVVVVAVVLAIDPRFLRVRQSGNGPRRSGGGGVSRMLVVSGLLLAECAVDADSLAGLVR